MPNWVKNEIVLTGPRPLLESIQIRAKPCYTIPAGTDWREFVRNIFENDHICDEAINRVIDAYGDTAPDADGRIPVIDINGDEDVFSFSSFVPEDIHNPLYQDAKQQHCEGHYLNPGFNWYEWRLKYWGVKWDASESSVHWEGDRLVFSFSTPWNPPEVFYDAFARMYPEVTLEAYGFEEQGQFYKRTYHGEVSTEPYWEWIEKRCDKVALARQFLATLGVDNIFDIVDFEKFVKEASFVEDPVENVRGYATCGMHLNEDFPKRVAMDLTSASNGKWEWDGEKYVYTPPPEELVPYRTTFKNDGCGGVECYSKESGHCNAGDDVFYPAFKADDVIYGLKKRIEDIQASNYAVCTDLGMDCHRYLRELWRSRARNAHTQVRFWTVRNACAFAPANIEGRIPGILKDAPEVKGILRTQGAWIRIWEKIEKVCSEYALNYTNELR